MNLQSLPQLGQPIDAGIFAGVITRPDGTHCAVIRLPENGTKLTWKKAMTWAKEQGGELPSRPVEALLFANVKAALPSGWHWTSEEAAACRAWLCGFPDGDIYFLHKGYEGSAVAVRLIPLISYAFTLFSLEPTMPDNTLGAIEAPTQRTMNVNDQRALRPAGEL